MQIWSADPLDDSPRLLAWSSRVFSESIDADSVLIATPRLCLTHPATLAIVGTRSYPRLFDKSTLVVGDETPRRFVLVRAEFPLWRNGEPEIRGFAVVTYLNTPPPHITTYISAAAELLKRK